MHLLNNLRKERTFYSHNIVTQAVKAPQGQKRSKGEVSKVILLNKCPAVILHGSRIAQLSALKSL